MKTARRMHYARGTLIACAAALLWTAGAALAAEPEHAARPAPTKEMREKMANAHEHMVACLRSDRPIADCHAEMMKQHEMMHHGEGEHEGMNKDDCAHKAHHDQEMKDSMKDHAANEPT